VNLTSPQREKTHQPKCPNCDTHCTKKDFGSRAEGEYIVYFCQTCADYLGGDSNGIVYQPVWDERPGNAMQPSLFQ
jgi:hypothetical protein